LKNNYSLIGANLSPIQNYEHEIENAVVFSVKIFSKDQKYLEITSGLASREGGNSDYQ
jgi:hypothetical protein